MPAKRTRSAVTNGRRAFVEGNGQSAWARRYRDLAHAHIADLGGAEKLSEAQISLCRRAATIELELEQMEGKLSLGALQAKRLKDAPQMACATGKTASCNFIGLHCHYIIFIRLLTGGRYGS